MNGSSLPKRIIIASLFDWARINEMNDESEIFW